jgi:hypothetical protein
MLDWFNKMKQLRKNPERLTLHFPRGKATELKIRALKANKSLWKYLLDLSDNFEETNKKLE